MYKYLIGQQFEVNGHNTSCHGFKRGEIVKIIGYYPATLGPIYTVQKLEVDEDGFTLIYNVYENEINPLPTDIISPNE